MIQTTRFNPTVNGPLHIGHLYNILVNEYEAHSTGGEFHIRFDDNQRWWLMQFSKVQIDDTIDGIMYDMDWMGIMVDKYYSQRSLEIQTETMLAQFNHGPLAVRAMVTNIINCPTLIDSRSGPPYPYAPWLTAEKVLLDFLEQVTMLIRGEDLVSEYSLYSYFCDLWGLPNPKHYYLPRLRLKHGVELADVSKTRGDHKIVDLRKSGYTPKDILDILSRSCLIDPDGKWKIDNIKQDPILVEK